MGRFKLLPGERIEVRLGASARASLGAFLACGLFLVVGGILWLILRAPFWVERGDGWRFWTWFVGYEASAYAWVFLVFGLVALAAWFVSRSRVVWPIAVASVVWVFALALQTLPWGYESNLPVAVASLTIVFALAVEVERRGHQVVMTNLRLVQVQMARPVRSVRHEDVRDLERHQGPVSRLVGTGSILVMTQAAQPGESGEVPLVVAAHLSRLDPLASAHTMAEGLVRLSTTKTPLRDAQLDARMKRARERLEGRGPGRRR